MNLSQPTPLDDVDATPAGRIDFLCREWIDCLPPFDVSSQPLEGIDELLVRYYDFLERDVSLAVARGTTLACTEVNHRLGNFFATASPTMINGPPMSWVELILALGPQPTFSQLASVQNRVRLASADQDFIRSGRPWRFLWPWPGPEDCDQEWQALQVTQEELMSVDRIARHVCETVRTVVGQIERRKALVRRMAGGADTTAVGSPWLLNAGAASTHESRASSLRRSPVGAGDTTNGTAASPSRSSTASPSWSSTRSFSAPLSTAPRSTATPSVHDTSPSPSSSQSHRSAPGTPHRRNTRTKSFIDKLHRALDDPAYTEALAWSPDGKSFVVGEKGLFSPQLLADLGTASYEPFIRRLYYFGFRKINGTFQHSQFVRDPPCPTAERVIPST